MISLLIYATLVAVVAMSCGWFVYNLEQGFVKWFFGQSYSAVLFKGFMAFCVLIAGLMLVGYLESLEASLP